MSDRAINEAITNMYNDITSIREQQNEMKNEIVKISTDISWMRTGIEEIDRKLDKCTFCKSPEELTKKIDNNKKDIIEIKENQNSIKYTAFGISAGISIIISILLFILYIKGVI